MPGIECFKTHNNHLIPSGTMWERPYCTSCARDRVAEAQRGWHVQGHTASKCWTMMALIVYKDFLTRIPTLWQVLARGIVNCLEKADNIKKRLGPGKVFEVVRYSPCPGQKERLGMSWSHSRLPAKILSFLPLTRGCIGLMWTGKIYPVTSELIYVQNL